MTTKLPLKRPVDFTGTAWTLKDVGGNEAQATCLEIEDGRVVKATVFPANSKDVVLGQVDCWLGESIVKA